MSVVTMATYRSATDDIPVMLHSEQLVIHVLPRTSDQATYVQFPVPSYGVTWSKYSHGTLPVLGELTVYQHFHENQLPSQFIDVSGGNEHLAEVIDFTDSSVNVPACVDDLQQMANNANHITKSRPYASSDSDVVQNDDSDSSSEVIEVGLPSVRADDNENSGSEVSVANHRVNAKQDGVVETSRVSCIVPKNITGHGSSTNKRLYPLYCGTCRLHLNAPRQAKEHFEGRAHARRFKLSHGEMESANSSRIGGLLSKQVNERSRPPI